LSLRSSPPLANRSLKKVIRNISGAFQTSFGDWTVGVGVEEQLSEIRELVGLSPLKSEFGKRFLAYKEVSRRGKCCCSVLVVNLLTLEPFNLFVACLTTLVCRFAAPPSRNSQLVRPEVIMKTLTEKTYEHNEDFFFRSVHLGTECWAFVALRRLDTAKKQLSEFSHWHNAAAHILSASHILSYLGDHIMMLTSMILRDYLKLKVEIEGTSGEGSSAVKMLRSTVKELYVPFISTLFELDGGEAFGESNGVSLDDAEQQALLLNLYSKPEKQPGLYSYAKALEAIESGLNGGFYYKHFCLASNVIGTGAKGTMNKSVKALKTMYERALFPNLDVVRSELGKKIDAELLHKKGKIMDSITKTHH
jgi:tryptophan 2,3-dioxygenase